MSVLNVASGEHHWRTTGRVHNLAIPLQFDGPQPRHFGASKATASPMQTNGFTGDTRQGGSCNADVVQLNAHCNGTHTECLGHLTNERLSVHDYCPALPILAAVASLTSQPADLSKDELAASSKKNDHVLDASLIEQALLPWTTYNVRALVIRTLPNTPIKQSKVYTDSADYPYLTAEAATTLIEYGIEHLLLDTPSADRFNDDGELTAHRRFFGLPAHARQAQVSRADATREFATLTEMIFVPDDVLDGLYLLNLQVPAFCLDAAPSRPILYEIEEFGQP